MNYFFKLWILLYAFTSVSSVIGAQVIGHWSWSFNLLVLFGTAMVSLCYVMANQDNPLGYADLW